MRKILGVIALLLFWGWAVFVLAAPLRGGVLGKPDTMLNSVLPAGSTVYCPFDGSLQCFGKSAGSGVTYARTGNSSTCDYGSYGGDTAAGAPCMGVGKVGRGIVVLKATTNLLSNNQASIDSGTTGYTALGATLSNEGTLPTPWYGANSLKIVTNNAAAGEGAETTAVTVSSTAATCSFHVYGSSGTAKVCAVERDSTDTTTVGTTCGSVFTVAPNYTAYDVSRTITSGNKVKCQVVTDVQQALTLYVDGAQLETGAFVTPWQYAGNGARSAENVSVSAASLSARAGTISFWANITSATLQQTGTPTLFMLSRTVNSGSNIGLFLFHTSGAATFTLQHRRDDNTVSSIAFNDPAIGWHHFAVTWAAPALQMWVDGVKITTSTITRWPSGFQTFYLGSNNGSTHANTVLDELRLMDRQLSPAEVNDLYQGGLKGLAAVISSPSYPAAGSQVDVTLTVNGVTDDSPTLQAALDWAAHFSGKVNMLPCSNGVALIKKTVEVNDGVELTTCANAPVMLKKTDDLNTVTDCDTNCVCTKSESGKYAVKNLKKDCSGQGIKYTNFKVDMSLVNPGTDTGSGPQYPSVAVILASATNAEISGITIRNAPQDGIFVKNGSNVRVHHNTLDGYNEDWANGSAINNECWDSGIGCSDIEIDHNTIVGKGPAFCANDMARACDEDADCLGGATCANTATSGAFNNAISTRRAGGGSVYPTRVDIHDNTMALTDRQIGITTVDCVACKVRSNTLTARASATLMSKQFTGIQSIGFLTSFELSNNSVTGGDVANDRRGILVDGGSSAYTDSGNSVSHKILDGSVFTAYEVRGVAGGTMASPVVSSIQNAPGLQIGGPGTTTSGLTVSTPTISDISGTNATGLRVRGTVSDVQINDAVISNASIGVEKYTGGSFTNVTQSGTNCSGVGTCLSGGW